jgi:hypothetical protein
MPSLKKITGKHTLFIGISLGVTFISLTSFFNGYEKTWRLWNIPVMSPCFADARDITSGTESKALGYNPYIYNPRDPWGRIQNYPRIWHYLYVVGINQRHTVYFGAALAVLFTIALFLYTPSGINNVTASILIASIFSPAVLLGIERGNIDLLMFFLLSVAIFIINKGGNASKVLATISVLVAFILKLFPIFGIGILLGQKKGTVLRAGFLVIIFAVVYTLISYNDLVFIRQITPKSTDLSYGANVLWMRVGLHSLAGAQIIKLLSYFALALCCIMSFYGLCSQKFGDLERFEVDKKFINSFRVGSGIYIGTFLLGNNWDYRLMFLLFVIPQLMLWSRLHVHTIITLISRLSVIAIIISLWYLVIYRFVSGVPFGRTAGFLIGDFSKWAVFGGLLFLFSCSAPQWLKETAVCMIPKKRPV